MLFQTILFDLDGTLLPMDQEAFLHAYFQRLASAMAPFGYEPHRLADCIWKGTGAMILNDGSKTNEQAFWQVFASFFGEEALRDQPHFDAFYRSDFQKVADSCGFNPEAGRLIRDLKAAGFELVLATNPVFPAIATHSRIRWAGLDKEDFALCTTYENTSFCKPNLRYYRDILCKIGRRPEECLMVGNDVDDDMVTEQLGMRTFLLTDCLINKSGADLGRYPHGGFAELRSYLKLSE